ncbi:hypothetical protein D3C86_1681030 [compost metagenome]
MCKLGVQKRGGAVHVTLRPQCLDVGAGDRGQEVPIALQRRQHLDIQVDDLKIFPKAFFIDAGQRGHEFVAQSDADGLKATGDGARAAAVHAKDNYELAVGIGLVHSQSIT